MDNIIICSTCHGSGEEEAWDEWHEKCKIICETCHGSGRMYRTTRIITFEVPFTASKLRLYKSDTALIDIARDLKEELKKDVPVPKKIKTLNALRKQSTNYLDYKAKVAKLEAKDIEDFYDNDDR